MDAAARSRTNQPNVSTKGATAGHRGAVLRLIVTAVVLAYAVGAVVHLLHGGQHELHQLPSAVHWLRDSTLALPLAGLAVWGADRVTGGRRDLRLRTTAALLAGVAFAALAVPGNLVHAALFLDEHAVGGHHGQLHLLTDAAAMVGPSVVAALLGSWLGDAVLTRRAALTAVPGGRSVRPSSFGGPTAGRYRGRRVVAVAVTGALATAFLPVAVLPAVAAPSAPTPPDAVQQRCTGDAADRVYDVAALQVEIPFNRWGQTDPNGLMYALEQDVAAIKNWYRPLAEDPQADPAANRRLRPRPLVLRANEGECVKVTLRNALPSTVMGGTVTDPRVSLHIHGASYDVATSDGSSVGHNPDTTVVRGAMRTYVWRAPAEEGLYEFHDHGMPAGSEADGGSVSHGLYGALAVEPAGSRWTDPRSGLELYPPSNVAQQSGDLYIDADITPPSGKAFRESVQLSQDEVPGIGFAFNYGSEPMGNRVDNLCPDCVGEETSLSSWTYGDPGLVKLASGGLPVPAPNPQDPDAVRLVGWLPTPGVDDEENCQSDTGDGRPRLSMPVVNGERVPASCWTATIIQTYQHDPTKIRYGHVGPKETHIFHLHAHQWLAEPEDVGGSGATPGDPSDTRRPESTTIDSQTYGPGDMFTADLLFGAGSKPGTAGDSIFHCHLYPHFADGFWGLLRVHDVLESGTGVTPDGIRVRPLLPLPDRTALPAPTDENPGYPRFIPGEFGWRAPQPPAATILGPDGQPALRVVAGQVLDAARMGMVQTVSTGATGPGQGAFTLTYGAEQTAAIDADAPATGPGSVESALQALEAIEDVTVTSPATGTWRITFEVPSRNIPALVAARASADGQDPVVTVEPSELAQRLARERDVLRASNGGQEPKPGAPAVDPCPTAVVDPVTGQTRPTRTVTYDAAVIQTDVVYNEAGWHDTQARIIVPLADVDAILAGTKKAEPLFLRVNAGDCVNYNLTNMLPNWFGNDAFVKLEQTNMVAGHIHLVKFDVLGSDGSSNGWNYQQAAYTKAQHEQLVGIAENRVACSADEGAGACRLELPGPDGYDPSWSGKLQGQTIRARWFADYELRTVFTHDHHFPALDQNRGLYGALVVEPAGMDTRNPVTGEYLQPINDPAHGAVCGTACTGTATGTMMDVIGPGATDDFREFGVTIQDFVSLTRQGGDPRNAADTFNPPAVPEAFPDADPGVMAINYRNAPLVLRNTVGGQPVDPAYVFSSRVFGDPATPVLQAYAGDPVRMRVVQGSQEEQHVLAVHGMRWRDEPDDPQSPLVAAKSLGISEAFNFEIPEMDCGVDEDCRGDYLYSGSSTDDIWLGAWGIMRVYGKGVKTLLPLPDRQVQAAQGNVNLTRTGTPPEPANKPGTPCPTTATVRSFQVVATDARIAYNGAGDHDPYGLVYAAVRPGETVDAAVARIKGSPEPMSLRANEGECIEVTLTNRIDPQGRFALEHAPRGAADGDPRLPLEAPTGTPAGLRVSLHPQLVKYDVRGSDGATVGFNRDQTVAPGQSILYRWWADDVTPGELGAINLLDFGDVRGHRHHGLFAGLTIQPAGATYHDPITGAEVVDGQSVDVRVPGRPDFRDFTMFFQDGLNLRDIDGQIIDDVLPHPGAPGEAALEAEDQGEKGFNYRNEPFHHRLGGHPVQATAARPIPGSALARVYSSTQHGDPATPIFRAYTGDDVRVRVLQGADKPRQHVFSQAGHSWTVQPDDPGSSLVGAIGGVGVGRAANLHLGSAGGLGQHRGDYRYGCLVGFHHLSGGLWGIMRVYDAPAAGSLFIPDAVGVGGPDSPYRDGYHPIQPLERSSLVARVFDDSNLDQQRGKDERPVAGTTITVTAKDGSGASQTKVAGADGTAAFTVAPGSYDVSTSVPADWAATTPTTVPVDAIGDAGLGEAGFGLVQLGDATVRLFQNINGDEDRDSDEPWLSGWKVTLAGTGGGTLTTGTDGTARWDGLKPGTYTATAAAPAGWLATRKLPVTLTLTENGSLTTDIGFALKAGLSVHVFNDSDSDLTQTVGTESSLAGWKVTVSGGPAELPVTLTATTDAYGNATFDDPDPAIEGLRPGTYTVTRTAPQPQWVLAGAMSSTDNGASTPLTCSTGACTTVLLEKTAQVVTLADHNDHSWLVAAPFNDINNDGARGEKESKLVGATWKAAILDGSGAVVARDVPVGSNGEAVFYPMAPGSYTLQMISPERSSDPAVLDWTSTNAGCRKLSEVDVNEPADSIRMICRTPVSVIPGERAVASFGFIQLGTVGVTVFQDFDRDGLEGAQARRIAGRTVYLYDEAGRTILQTKTTDSAGMVAFKVSAGIKYQVQAVLPTAWAQTTPLAVNGTPVLKVKVTAPTSVLQSVEQVFGQYNTKDTTPPPDPVPGVAPGTYTATQSVTLTSEAGATFRYTLDGSSPSASVGMVYSGPITIGTSHTLKAVAIDVAGNESTTQLTASYVIDRGAGVMTVPAVVPTTWTVITGGAVRGSAPTVAENLAFDDDVRRQFLPAALAGKAYVADGYASVTLPPGQRGVVALGIDYDGGASLATATRTLFLYSWTTKKWEQVQPSQAQSVADMRVTWDAGGDPKRFVSGTGEIRVRVSATRSAPFELRADQLNLVIGHTR